MRLLVLGGTVFLGRAFVEEAVRAGHEVTTFNRGRSAADLPGVTAVRGDRTDPADVQRLVAAAPRREGAHLHGGWDAVVDTSGFVPRHVLTNVEQLREHARRYLFVSTVGVYDGWPGRLVDEGASTLACEPDAGPDDGDYGTLKAGCERAVAEHFGAEAVLLRPGVILGPYENVGRLPYWLSRVADGGDVLAPGDPDVGMQLVDARDVAAYGLHLLHEHEGGAFDVVGPQGTPTYREMLEECLRATGSDARLVWVDDATLLEHGVDPWDELPLWLPTGDAATEPADFAWRVPGDKARATGLRTRPFHETVEDTWRVLQTGWRPVAREGSPRRGMDREKERRILAAVSTAGREG